MKKLNGLSLFSSAGIGELNLKEVGIDIVVANELLEKRAKVYKHLHPKSQMVNGDILKKEIKEEIIYLSKKNKVNFMLLTPPCQGISSVGKNKKQDQYVKDRRNFLILETFEIINELKPDYLLIENVPRFLDMFFPYANNLYKLETILNNEYGHEYNIESEVLNAKDYGVAQSRPRCLIKLYKKGRKWPWPEKEREISLKEAIGHLPSLEPGEHSTIKWHYAKKVREEIADALRHTESGKSAISNEIHYPRKENGERIKGFHNTYKRMKWDQPASARTTYSGSVSSHNNVHPGHLKDDGKYSDPRVLSILETFLVSSIEPSIDFPENLSDTFIRTIIGEAIPPKMLSRICKHIDIL
ncbi:DNA cytosine methyltransferase [Salinicoccus roseus]|uniref:DNA (cytosine-5-)-methyltransferase n=1 Tax=Salinicoccus roseus TaxID=45670 RepID=A0A265E9K3_9STAP|nr:DNA cytosine methyltransferase [Salinicoccus roseus]OZT78257.1 modification methylase [Salinicoccus roseus]